MEHMAHLTRALSAAGFIAVLATGAGGAAAQTSDPESILKARCGACHEARADGKLSRVADIRKTPEGWDMTLVRMDIWHGVKLVATERAALVKYLSDTQGLAPKETTLYRYILERNPNAFDVVDDEELQVVCARCHSFARAALQRRDADEWLKLAHTHAGQWPTMELQYGGRDRDLWTILSTKLPKVLGDMFPFKTAEWDAWKDRGKANIEGAWRVVGHRRGAGDYQGTATVRKYGEDLYEVRYDLTYDDGTKVNGTGDVTVYTGYEWRGSVRLGQENVREVFALSEDGNSLSGRWFLADSDEIGARARGVRLRAGHSEILAVSPTYLRAGAEAEIAIHGIDLGGKVSLGDGVEIIEVLDGSGPTVRVRVKAAADAANGSRTVTVGATSAAGLLTVFDNIDSVRVDPDLAIGRVGGGAIAPVTAQFDAVAYLNGADGEAGTDDDVRIGVMPAVWSVDNFNETAAALDDAKFAGAMQPGGLFVPAIGGPNSARKFGTNNWGDLAVKATVSDAGREVEGAGHLIVTVQRWNDPPIR